METAGIRRFLLKGIPKQFKDFGPILPYGPNMEGTSV